MALPTNATVVNGKYVNKILFTDRYKVTETRLFADQIPFIDGTPPKFLCWDGKLWQRKGGGITSWFYHEVESFVML